MDADPELTAETRAWLTKSANDLRAAEALIDSSPPLLDEAVFHCQQAAEKSLKGFLAWHQRPFRKTHNLEEIGEQCLAIDPTLSETVDQAVPLTEYAWRFRYPGDPKGIDANEAGEALKTASIVHDAILCRLPPDARP
jgi:HEPN domain-containing protein